MPLINTAGLTIIGDGSQWFWAMLSFLAIPITGYAIYSQLRIARSLRARDEVEGLDREWDSERLIRYRLEVLRAIRDGADAAHFPLGAVAGIAIFWDRIGELVRSRHLDDRTLHHRYSRICQAWWAVLATGVRRSRTERGVPDLFMDFEWLARRMAGLDRTRSRPTVDPKIQIELVDGITTLEGQLRVEEALRSVTTVTEATTRRRARD